MAISAVPFALQNVPINADVVRTAVASLVPNAGGLVSQNDFMVAQTGTASMAVTVGVGRAWIPGTNVSNLAGQTYGKQGMYFVLNDASVTLTIATANATNPRIDVVYLAIRDAAYTGSNNDAQLAVATGTPNATPSAPALPNNAIAVAQVTVPANATSIVNANITDLLSSVTAPAIGLIASNPQATGTTFFGTTEQQISSVQAYLVAGRSYRIRASVDASSNTSGTYVNYQLKYGSTGGNTGTSTRKFTGMYATNGSGQSYDIVGQPFVAAASGLSLCTLTAQITIATSATVTAPSGSPASVSISVEDLG